MEKYFYISEQDYDDMIVETTHFEKYTITIDYLVRVSKHAVSF